MCPLGWLHEQTSLFKPEMVTSKRVCSSTGWNHVRPEDGVRRDRYHPTLEKLSISEAFFYAEIAHEKILYNTTDNYSKLFQCYVSE